MDCALSRPVRNVSRSTYCAARRLARRQHWLRNPVRVVDGWPGLWVGASGVYEFDLGLWEFLPARERP